MATREIAVSTAVYSAIWGDRRPGEETEDAILRRKFQLDAEAPVGANVKTATTVVGFKDSRFGVEVAEGFEIFRVYLGTEYRARAVGGQWILLSTGKRYPSLNKLSRAIGAKIENAWINWYYRESNGKRQLITKLRK